MISFKLEDQKIIKIVNDTSIIELNDYSNEMQCIEYG